jgi:ABC-type glutathione transport system ATPase component
MLTANEILEWDDAGSPAVVKPLLDVEGLCKSFTVKPAGWRTQIWRPWQRRAVPDAPVNSPAQGPISRSQSIRPALDQVSLMLMPGVSVGITGPAGAGKSTLARLIVGQLAPDAGSATRSCRVQLLPQDGAALFPARQTIAHVVAAAFTSHQLSRDDAHAAAEPLLERVGLTPSLFATETMARLSKGQRQRVAIALALIGDPQLIILDEPTAGLGAVAAAPLIELLQDLRLERDLTYLVLTRDPDVASALAGTTTMTLTAGRLSPSAPERCGAA